eukprot:PhM_4_TR11856/c0_g1_i1/m.65905
MAPMKFTNHRKCGKNKLVILDHNVYNIIRDVHFKKKTKCSVMVLLCSMLVKSNRRQASGGHVWVVSHLPLTAEHDRAGHNTGAVPKHLPGAHNASPRVRRRRFAEWNIRFFFLVPLATRLVVVWHLSQTQQNMVGGGRLRGHQGTTAVGVVLAIHGLGVLVESSGVLVEIPGLHNDALVLVRANVLHVIGMGTTRGRRGLQGEATGAASIVHGTGLKCWHTLNLLLRFIRFVWDATKKEALSHCHVTPEVHARAVDGRGFREDALGTGRTLHNPWHRRRSGACKACCCHVCNKGGRRHLVFGRLGWSYGDMWGELTGTFGCVLGGVGGAAGAGWPRRRRPRCCRWVTHIGIARSLYAT